MQNKTTMSKNGQELVSKVMGLSIKKKVTGKKIDKKSLLQKKRSLKNHFP